jgi:N-ethylmaleimide reductase
VSVLFDEFRLGRLLLANRIVMAPLTRNRADRHGVPSASAAEYYRQRASAGLMISEGSQPSAAGQGFVRTPGLHHRDQLDAWEKVTGAVHDAGGLIFAQIMHTGRIGHRRLARHPEGPAAMVPVAPSAVRMRSGQAQTYDGLLDFEQPRRMSGADITQTVRDFADAAGNAVRAGFDGVELHGANGCLLHQFLATGTNLRDDAYGGSVDGRVRFVHEVVAAVAERIGADRVGLRISPANRFNDMQETDTAELYGTLLAAVAPLEIGYLHVYETGDRAMTKSLRSQWRSAFVLNPHPSGRVPTDGPAAQQALDEGLADLVSFGRNFISNPDLPLRLRLGAPLAEPDPSTFYGGGDHGYVDYPPLSLDQAGESS